MTVGEKMHTLYANRKCKDCWNWNKLEGKHPKAMGECRDSPPLVLSEKRIGSWPCTGEDDWCGKFFPLEVVEGKKPDLALPKG